jgi:hypothetical protein
MSIDYKMLTLVQLLVLYILLFTANAASSNVPASSVYDYSGTCASNNITSEGICSTFLIHQLEIAALAGLYSLNTIPVKNQSNLPLQLYTWLTASHLNSVR